MNAFQCCLYVASSSFWLVGFSNPIESVFHASYPLSLSPPHPVTLHFRLDVLGLQPIPYDLLRRIPIRTQPRANNVLFSFLFSAVPIGKPITTIAHNTSATSLYISWKPPPPDTILGEFLGYRITYRTRDKHNHDLREIYIRDSGVEVCR